MHKIQQLSAQMGLSTNSACDHFDVSKQNDFSGGRQSLLGQVST